jgi:5-methylcytosine-specific restriction endonuclease McrA
VKVDKDKSLVISDIANMILEDKEITAKEIIKNEYPHTYFEIEKRTYTMVQKMNQFIRDGFIDRYTGQKLLNPGILKIISHYFPNEFPYHPHWKMTETHIAYWELIPTIDHIYPIAKGGQDDEKNWVTTSMKNNSIKSNYTIDEIHWNLYPKGDIADWDGLTKLFLKLVEKDKGLLKDGYIRSWYNVSKTCLYNEVVNE